jgi:superfamily I DNA/RNA helicase
MMRHDVADANAHRAVEAPVDGPLLVITGPAASGKTETLARRYATIVTRDPSIGLADTIVSAGGEAGAALLAARIRPLLDAVRTAEFDRDARYVGKPLVRLAFDLLAEHAAITGLAADLESIDAFDAEEIFDRAIAPLFSAEWGDYLGAEIDPEIPGLRAPQRFATAVLRLIRKLRDAQISPDEFLSMSLRGATAFYANPPNLSSPSLLYATKDEHRPALSVDAGERERQRLRELDLAKIIAKIYRSYLDELVAYGCLTDTDAIAEAIRLLTEHPSIARALRKRFRLAVVDDVHDVRTGEFRLLQTIFGKTLHGVSVAGDPEAATDRFSGARPERVFAVASTTIALQANYCVPRQIAAVVRALLEPEQAHGVPAGDAVRLHRAATQAAEAQFVGDSIAELVRTGTPPGRIAVVHRSARSLGVYEDALVDRNIRVGLAGDAALFARHDTLDALALLWSTVDPFAHAWLLRVLQMPFMRLSDASLALLCGEPASTQALLFDLPQTDDPEGGRRWDRRRDLRLGTNVVRGDRDADLSPQARERLAAFRARRVYWQTLARTSDATAAARAILRDGGIFATRTGETGARTRRRAQVAMRLLGVIERYAQRYPMDDLAGALRYCDRIARSEDGPVFDGVSLDAVTVGSIDRIKARRFDHVFIVDVRAGSFPPYYVPDAFLFSPTYGMIPKDSVGEAVTARTAKFTWYQHHSKLRDTYGREDRRALAVALARADVSATVSVSGRATRGVGAPEFMTELQTIRPALPEAPQPPPSAPPDDGDVAVIVPTEQPAQTPSPRTISLERAAAMVQCIRCAPRRALLAALVAPAPLLREASNATVLRFSVAFGDTIVCGAVGSIETDGRIYAQTHGEDAATHAAIAIFALESQLEASGYYRTRDDGTTDGPHAVDPNLLEHVRAVISGDSSPVCNSCSPKAT